MTATATLTTPHPAPHRVQARAVPEHNAPVIDPRFLTRTTHAPHTPAREHDSPAVPPPTTIRRLRVVPAADDSDFGPRHTPSHALPDAGATAARLAPILMQVAGGVRAPAQVTRFTTTQVQQSLTRRHLSSRRAGLTRHPMRVRRVHAGEPRDGVAEAAVVIEEPGRVRALAIRLEGQDGRWVVTALQIG